MSERIFNAADYGLVAGTEAFQDGAIQKAIDEAFLAGGGTVEIPGGTYRVRGLRLRSRVTLHLLENAVLEGSRDYRDYFILKNDKIEPVEEEDIFEGSWARQNGGGPLHYHFFASRWHNAVIRMLNARDVAIIGEKGSVIDGRNCYDGGGEEGYRGPHGIAAHNCENVTLKGYTAQHTGNWAQILMKCRNILIEGVTNIAGHDGPHLTSCRDIVIRNCVFSTGDDCVAGFNNRNVLVEDCELNTACSAFRFGGENVLIQRCRVIGPARNVFRGSLSQEEKINGVNANDVMKPDAKHRFNMLSLFTYYCDYSLPNPCPGRNIVIRDCEVENADRFLFLNFGNQTWQSHKPLLDITFENIRAKGLRHPLYVHGDKENPVTVTMKNVELSYHEEAENTEIIRAANVKQLSLKNVTVTGARADTLIRSWDEGKDCRLIFENLKSEISEDRRVVYADPAEEFGAKKI